MRGLTLLAAACASAALCGCGSSVPDGAHVFARSCRACHSLIGNESRRKQGGDLLGYHFTRSQLASYTRVMPARLTAAELRAVVDYVLRVQAHGRT